MFKNNVLFKYFWLLSIRHLLKYSLKQSLKQIVALSVSKCITVTALDRLKKGKLMTTVHMKQITETKKNVQVHRL